MRALTLSLLVAAVLAVAVPAAVDAAAPKTARVELGDDYFDPETVTIRRHGTVTWRWVGENPHNVALTKPGAHRVATRSRLKESGRFSYVFDQAGTWRAVCEVHPRKMRMKVVVKRG
jgi:plastocyanin